jgi:hypothetical protein
MIITTATKTSRQDPLFFERGTLKYSASMLAYALINTRGGEQDNGEKAE